MDDDNKLVTLTDIAAMMDVSKGPVQEWSRKADWPMTAGTVTRQGRERTAWRWGDVQDFCLSHGLPRRSTQDTMRAKEARPED